MIFCSTGVFSLPCTLLPSPISHGTMDFVDSYHFQQSVWGQSNSAPGVLTSWKHRIQGSTTSASTVEAHSSRICSPTRRPSRNTSLCRVLSFQPSICLLRRVDARYPISFREQSIASTGSARHGFYQSMIPVAGGIGSFVQCTPTLAKSSSSIVSPGRAGGKQNYQYVSPFTP
jgi:hypothetical protein